MTIPNFPRLAHALSHLRRSIAAHGCMCGVYWKSHWRKLLCSFVVVALLVCWLMSVDAVILKNVQLEGLAAAGVRKWLRGAAGLASRWGNFTGFGMGVPLVIWLVGWLRKSPHLKKLALVSLCSAIVCGLTVNAIKGVVGRPRPFAVKKESFENGFCAPALQHKVQSFPSGHTATAFGAAVPVLLVLPGVGVPMMLCAAVIAWSRLFLDQHHLSDVLASIWLAIFIGLPLGRALLRERAE